jgi:hypothetical protein
LLNKLKLSFQRERERYRKRKRKGKRKERKRDGCDISQISLCNGGLEAAVSLL